MRPYKGKWIIHADMMKKKVTHNRGRKRAVSFEMNINIHQWFDVLQKTLRFCNTLNVSWAYSYFDLMIYLHKTMYQVFNLGQLYYLFVFIIGAN